MQVNLPTNAGGLYRIEVSPLPMLKFRCKACDKVFEELTSVSAMDKVLCPDCGAKGAERAYEGKCMFGMKGSDAGRGCSCSGGSCGSCSGCGAHA